MQWGLFSFSHGLLGLDFPTNVQAICFGQTVSECSSANGLHSRGGQGAGHACMGVERYVSKKKIKIKRLTCRGGWTPLKRSKNYESFSTVAEIRPGMVYNIW